MGIKPQTTTSTISNLQPPKPQTTYSTIINLQTPKPDLPPLPLRNY